MTGRPGLRARLNFRQWSRKRRRCAAMPVLGFTKNRRLRRPVRSVAGSLADQELMAPCSGFELRRKTTPGSIIMFRASSSPRPAWSGAAA